MLKPLGYRKDGSTFRKKLNDDVILVVNLQKSDSCSRNHVKAYVNLGVLSLPYAHECHRQGLWVSAMDNASLDSPSVSDCQLGHLRLGGLGTQDRQDQWWVVETAEEAAAAGEQIAKLLIKEGLPFLDAHASTEQVCAWEVASLSGYAELPYSAQQRLDIASTCAEWLPTYRGDRPSDTGSSTVPLPVPPTASDRPSDAIDTLPPAFDDSNVLFDESSDRRSYCRYRLYKMADYTPVIVLTEVADRAGPRVTECAGRAFYSPCRELGHPWPCRFVEHHVGRPGAPQDSADAERLDEVTFAGTSEGRPIHVDEAFVEPVRQQMEFDEFHALVGAVPAE